MTKGASTYYLTYDQVGSLRGVFDSTGNIVKRIDYDSFGNILADTAPAFSVPFGFAGGLSDRDTALVHFGFRDYDPATGRWTAKDPIGFGGGIDFYSYVANSQINFIDSYGLLEFNFQNAFNSGITSAAGGALGGFFTGLWGGPAAPFTATGGAIWGAGLGFVGGFLGGGFIREDQQENIIHSHIMCTLGGSISGAIGGWQGAVGGGLGGGLGSITMQGIGNLIGKKNASAFGGAVGGITGGILGGIFGLTDGYLGAAKGIVSGFTSGLMTGGLDYYINNEDK